MSEIAAGQLWRHRGRNGIRPSGLRIRIEKVEPPYLWASYPGEQPRGKHQPPLRRYPIDTFNEIHELIAESNPA